MANPVRLCRAHGRRRVHRQPAAWAAAGRRLCREQRARCGRLFSPGRRRADGCRGSAQEPGLRAIPPPTGRSGAGGDVRRRDCSADRRPNSRRAGGRIDDHGRPCRLPAGQAIGAVPPVSNLHRLRSAAAVERGRASPAVDDPRADRRRQPRAGRSAIMVPVRRSEPHHVRRPRSLCRRSGLRPGAGGGYA